MKKITSLLLIMALAIAFLVTAKSEVRHEKRTLVKSEVSVKIVKTDAIVKNLEVLVIAKESNPVKNVTVHVSEAKVSAGLITASANYVRINRYNKGDALIKYKNLNYSFTHNQPTNRRLC